MINIIHKEDCCGCTACASICPQNAISMKPDGLGFLYPDVNLDLCIKCNLCERVCAFHKNYSTGKNLSHPDIYAVRHKNIHEVESSRSGAMFIALSDFILKNNGIIYGVGYKDHFRVVHKRAETAQERNEFKGSKYVQSDLCGIFELIAKDLQNKRMVLFSGTPCQTAGLYSFLLLKKIDCDRLVLCDIICHGVPAPYIWRDYIDYLEKRHKKRILSVNFRDKSKLGWAEHKESFCYEGGHYEIRDFYSYVFRQGVMHRHSCGVCPYTNFHRPSDITLGDYWGWERLDRDMNKDDKGISLVFVNTEKGRALFKEVSDSIIYKASCVEKCLQHNLSQPTIIHKNRMAFEKEYEEKGFLFVMKKYGNLNWSQRTQKVYRKARRLAGGVIKSLLGIRK